MKNTLIALAFFLVSMPGKAQTTATDEALVKEAIANYIDAFYQADTLKAYKSVAKDLAKRGYYTRNGAVQEASMSFNQLVSLAKEWKKKQTITATTPRKITVFEVLDRVATAKVEAKWGIDYFHLAKVDDQWLIKNVLWQEYPKSN